MYLLYKHVKAKRKQSREARLQQQARFGGVAKETEADPTQDAPNQIATEPSSEAPKAIAADISLAEKQDAGLGTTPDGKSLELKQVKHDRRVYRWKLIFGLLIPYMLASLDLTVVATASPYVAGHFGKLNQLNWIATAYTLTSTAFIPTFGQLADILGRHAVLQSAMIFMCIGSVLCAAAQDWAMLLLGRALQGTGAAGIMNIVKIVLADKVSLEENAKNTTIFALVGGISYSIGPIIGGYLTNANWRYCFVLSIPLSVLASLIMFFLLRKDLVRGTHQDLSWRKLSTLASVCSTLDIGGTLLFIFGVGLIILATAWGGSTYPWNSTAVLVPLVIGPVLFCSFFLYEYLLEPGRLVKRMFPTQVSMIPWTLFQRRDTIFLAILNFATGAALYSIFYFMGVYFIVALGLKAGDAGVDLVFYLPGLGGGVYLCMALVNWWPGQTFWPLLLGSICEAAGFGLLTWGVTTSNVGLVRGLMALAGVGTGLRLMPTTLHGVGMWPDRIAGVLSLMDFALPFGGTIGLTIMGSVFNNKMSAFTTELGTAPANVGHFSSSGAAGLPAIQKLPPQLRDAVRHAASNAVMWAFVSILPVMACCVLAASLLGNVWVKGRKKDGTTQVIYSSYLVALFTGTVRSKKVSNRPFSEDPAEDVAK